MFGLPSKLQSDGPHSTALHLIDTEIALLRSRIATATQRERYAQQELRNLGKQLEPLLVSRAALVGSS